MNIDTPITLDTLKLYLDFFHKMYEGVRLVDPVAKKVLDYRYDGIKETEIICYAYWRENGICDNCISIRAYRENDTYMKLEHTLNRLFMVTAIPVEVECEKIVLELMKDVTDSMFLGNGEYGKGFKINNIISDISDTIVRDSLTGLYNRRYIHERLPVDIIKNYIEKRSLSVIMTDIDCFKNINDTYGHTTGDMIIKEFGNQIFSCIKDDTNWVARYGGDEFLICLNDTDQEMAYSIAEKMRKKIEDTIIQYKDNGIKITGSFGICTITDEEKTEEEVICYADCKLYEAKKFGRNSVVY